MSTLLLFVLFCLIYIVTILSFLLIFFKITELFSIDAPYIPSSQKVVDRIIENLELTNKSVLFDLGCGDARIIRRATELYPQIKAVGVEIAFIPFFLAKFFTRGNKRIEIKRENIFKTDLSEATHIFLFLHHRAVNDLINNIKRQCSPGTRLISCDFEIKSCQPIKIVGLENKSSKICQRLFVYTL